MIFYCIMYIFFFKQKTAYEMRISDWSSDVCSSDLRHFHRQAARPRPRWRRAVDQLQVQGAWQGQRPALAGPAAPRVYSLTGDFGATLLADSGAARYPRPQSQPETTSSSYQRLQQGVLERSEEHTSELQSLMRISYAVFCLKKKKTQI